MALEWHRPNRASLQNLFRHPIYAGAYVYGLRPTDRRRQKPGRRSTGRRTLRAEEADVFLRDRVLAYITWEQYQRNRVCRNRTAVGRREPAVLCSLALSPAVAAGCA
jgi:hypothetical protein